MLGIIINHYKVLYLNEYCSLNSTFIYLKLVFNQYADCVQCVRFFDYGLLAANAYTVANFKKCILSTKLSSFEILDISEQIYRKFYFENTSRN